jgi:hypothetical protein
MFEVCSKQHPHPLAVACVLPWQRVD